MLTAPHFAVTHPSLHIRDARDAHIILEAVRLNILPLIKRRPGAAERAQLDSGNVFVWEESQDDGLLARWTDGRKWSQSRMRGDCLFYEEKIETTQDEKDAKAARRARRTSDPTAVLPPPTRRKDRPAKINGLTKQTYSASVYLPGTVHPRKWHVVAYFRGNDYTKLPVIESYDYLRSIRIPDGIFVSSKVGSKAYRNVYDSETSPETYDRDPSYDDNQTTYSHDAWASDRPLTSSSSSSASIMDSPNLSYLSPPSQPERITLPPITSLYPSYPSRPDITHRQSAPCSIPRALPSPSCGAHKYTPLTEEDRRVLERFRVVL